MKRATRSYIISCTPRSGSHLLAGGLGSTAVAGHPTERFPRLLLRIPPTPTELDAWITRTPDGSSYEPEQDARYVEEVISLGTTDNGVFGVTIHWFQLNDAVRRVNSYLMTNTLSPHVVFSSAFAGLSYIWLRRRDKIAQAVSWYRAIQTGHFVKIQGENLPQDERTSLIFDFTKIKTYLNALQSSDNGWKYFFQKNHLRPFVVYYEDLAIEYDRTVRDCLKFLDIPCADVVIPPPRFERSADAESLEWIERFRAADSRKS